MGCILIMLLFNVPLNDVNMKTQNIIQIELPFEVRKLPTRLIIHRAAKVLERTRSINI